MPGEAIFVNYRQNGSQDGGFDRLPHVQVVEAITERLRRHFGANQVFLDTGIRAGEHYPDALRVKLRDAELLIVVLHRGWLRDLEDRMGRSGVDWVRDEIRTALDDGKHVLPVLIDKAGLPSLDALPEDIRPFALKQLRRIDFGHWERDVRLLIQEVEAYLSPVSLPEKATPPLPRPRHPVLPAITWLVGALIPFAASTVFASTVDQPAWLTAAAVAGVLVLFVISLVAAANSWGYRYLDRLDREYTALPRDLKLDVILALMACSVGLFVLLTIPELSANGRMLLVAVVVLLIIGGGVPGLRKLRSGLDWPQPGVEADPTTVRRAINTAAEHISHFTPPLNRTQRDQGNFALDRVEEAVAGLRELSARRRITWFRATAPWLTSLHTLLAGATVGASVSALPVYWSSGLSHWSAPLWCAAGVVLAVAFQLGALESVYRLHRRRGRAVIETTSEKTARLRALISESSVPAPPKKYEGPSAHRRIAD
ncbi:hypothetical protein F4560_007722 [Saccharothrix ecbatanensis]|uniref:TIR domain-containing protein n=1 Tax=Saccharothrix ecbatanensis TaxID=1105145 RepID=A0A7W9HU20_9PSEU|nr:TIR domain-containing protein [Saccharothrix ecbatanensis]MBB5807954.1 hypothetical protein [Saccharothrix ecbatanensis]